MYTHRDRLGTIGNLSRRVEELSEEVAKLKAENAKLRAANDEWRLDAVARAQGRDPLDGMKQANAKLIETAKELVRVVKEAEEPK